MSAVAALIGWSLQTFALPSVLTVYWAYSAPQMLLVSLFAATLAVLAQIFPSVMYIIVSKITKTEDGDGVGGSNYGSTSNLNNISVNTINAFYLICGLISIEIFRAVLCYALVHAELQFRARSGQSLSGSKFGTIFTGLAAGVGFGTMLAIFSTGTAINLATSLSFDFVVAYDYAICPSMPLLQAQCLSGLFLIVANIFWTIIVLQCVTSFVVSKKIRMQDAAGGAIAHYNASGNLPPQQGAAAGGGVNSCGAAMLGSDDPASPTISMSPTRASTAANQRVSLLPKRRRAAVILGDGEADDIDGSDDNDASELRETPSSPLPATATMTTTGRNREPEEEDGADDENTSSAANESERALLLADGPTDDDTFTATAATTSNNSDASMKKKKNNNNKNKRGKTPRRAPRPPLAPPDFRLINPTQLAPSQANLFYGAVVILHFVFRAITLVYAGGNAISTATTSFVAGGGSGDVSGLSFYTTGGYFSAMPVAADDYRLTADLNVGQLFSTLSSIGGGGGFSSASLAGGGSPIYVQGGGMFSDTDQGSDLAYGGCAIVLPVQGLCVVFAALLGGLIAWTDRR